MPIKSILFDHDGTLVNSEVVHFTAWKKALQFYGINFLEQEYKDHCAGLSTIENAQYILNTYTGISLNNISDIALAEKKNSEISQYLKQQPYPLMPNAVETIKYFYQKKLRLAVVSGARRISVDTTIKNHNVEKYFSQISTSDDVVNNKPHPDVYLHALKHLNIDASECVAIEDSFVGVNAAHAAGIKCCAVTNAYSVNHDLSNATVIVDSLEKAKVWIDSLL